MSRIEQISTEIAVLRDVRDRIVFGRPESPLDPTGERQAPAREIVGDMIWRREIELKRLKREAAAVHG